PRWAEAAACYQAARAVRPELGVRLARVLTTAGRAAEGEAVLRALLRDRPGHPPLLVHLGENLSRQGRHPEAEAACREALRMDPAAHPAPLGRGVVWGALGGGAAGAGAEFRPARRLSPDAPAARHNLGVALLSRGRPAEAEAELRAALRRMPDDPKAHLNLGN